MKTTNVKIDSIKESPNNPRIIRDHKFKDLVRSIQDFPEMMQVRPLIVNPKNEIIGGNMRYRAAKAAGLTEVPVIKVTWKEAKQKEFVIKDNVAFGEWDWDVLANEWENTSLNDWGLPVWDADLNAELANLGEDLSHQVNAMKGEVKRSICIEFSNDIYDEAFDEVKRAREGGVNVGEFLLGALKQI